MTHCRNFVQTRVKGFYWLFALLSGSGATPPVFKYPNQILQVDIDEGSKVGSLVTQVRAEGQGHVNYSMQAWRASVDELNNALFAMDTQGHVRTISPIDLEDLKVTIKPQYKFKVTAMNRDNSESSFCWLLIDINDVNDNPPRFGLSQYRFRVSESVPPKTIVGRVDVTDRDQLDNGKLKLNLLFTGTPPPFSIDANGRIQTTHPLDREKVEKFKFDVLAKDSTSPVHTAKVNTPLIPP